MQNDMVNGCFEFIGSAFLWLNVRRLAKDKSVSGVDWRSMAFFFSWGVWNLHYYPSLGQWWSLAGGISISIANGVWVALALRYRKAGR